LQEKNISYSSTSALTNDLHPVRPGIKETFDEEIEEKEEVIVEENKKETEVKKDIKVNDEKTKIVEKKNNG
jgi:hypothetical protein